MTRFRDVARKLPVYTAEILRDTSDPNDYDASPAFGKVGELDVCILEEGGVEAFRLGLSVSEKLRRIFSDPDAGELSTSDRLQVRGETLDVLSVRAVRTRRDSLCIAEAKVM